MNNKIVITGGAGYIGSVLVGSLLRQGFQVDVIDKLLFGGEHMLCYKPFGLTLTTADVMEESDEFYFERFKGARAVIHLAALVGFPACQQVGPVVARRYNVESTERMFDLANKAGVPRFVFASTYSNYGTSTDDKPVNEDSPLNPQSLYAETKIEAEQLLLNTRTDCKPLIFRFSTLFGLSPRMRFDLIVNQFVLEAITKGKIIIYQKNYRRSYCHITDCVRAVALGTVVWSDQSYNQIWNVGSNTANLSKEDVINLIKKQVPVEIEYKDLSFGGDMRDITVSFDKIFEAHTFQPKVSVEQGIAEVGSAIKCGIIKNPLDDKYRNAKFIVS